VTDQELDQAVNAAIDTINFRADLKHALEHFIECGDVARELLSRATNEANPMTDRVLKTELMWAKHLRDLIQAHDFDGARS
jgi:hypothetical protein